MLSHFSIDRSHKIPQGCEFFFVTFSWSANDYSGSIEEIRFLPVRVVAKTWNPSSLFYYTLSHNNICVWLWFYTCIHLLCKAEKEINCKQHVKMTKIRLNKNPHRRSPWNLLDFCILQLWSFCFVFSLFFFSFQLGKERIHCRFFVLLLVRKDKKKHTKHYFRMTHIIICIANHYVYGNILT